MIRFCRHPASFKLKISKVQDFENFELSPMYYTVYALVHRQHCHLIFVGKSWLKK